QELGTLGFECTLEEVDLEDITKNHTNTIQACMAEDPAVRNRSSFGITFSSFRRKCLQGIFEDLHAYRAALKNLNDQKVLATIDEMMKVSIS
ncbi:IL12A protein, partial [Urocolius indicus]|nr:IL12A protein [Urocolius indicus]